MTTNIAAPLVFSPTMEVREPDEDATIAELAATLRSITQKTYADSGRGLRNVHAKSHGLLHGELEVLPDIAPELAQGVFRQPMKAPVRIRLSTTPGDVLDDHVSTPRGFALKIVGVDGVRLPGSEADRTQDFIAVNGPAFNAPSVKAFLKNVKLLAATTDRAPGLKRALSAALRGAETVIESVGGESVTLKALGGHPLTHLLGETFYTQVPVLYGPFIAKLQFVPVSPALVALKGAALDMRDHPDGIRDAVVAFFDANDAEWDVRVQLCTHLEDMPIEDSSKPWPETESPYRTVARVRVPRQRAWSEAESPALEDRLFFNPWHCIAAHRPLGSINRARKVAYEASATIRAELNHVDVAEPARAD